MKNQFFILLTAGSLVMYSCNSGNKTEASNVEEKTELSQAEVPTESEKDKKDTAVSQKTVVAESAESKATAEMCACINSSLKGMSPKIQQIFIRAGNSERPLQVLQNEIVTISDQEQMELFEQLQRFSTEPQLQKCSEDIRKKYGLDDNDKAAQERVLREARVNKDCELVYALIKIGMQQQPGAGAGN
ncbi:MAG TPA: hypothetical protein VGN63_24565 [Flavisolibacter sp.]|jgi:hypothetical protein|nr:hypothetical protein [Flavisolibacter sp.]